MYPCPYFELNSSYKSIPDEIEKKKKKPVDKFKNFVVVNSMKILTLIKCTYLFSSHSQH